MQQGGRQAFLKRAERTLPSPLPSYHLSSPLSSFSPCLPLPSSPFPFLFYPFPSLSYPSLPCPVFSFPSHFPFRGWHRTLLRRRMKGFQGPSPMSGSKQIKQFPFWLLRLVRYQ